MEGKSMHYMDDFGEDIHRPRWLIAVYRAIVIRARTLRYVLLVVAGYIVILISFLSLRITSTRDLTQQPCEEHVNIAFIKVPKTGSSTVANILLRYAFLHHLSPVLPNTANKIWLGWPGKFDHSYIQPPYKYSLRGENYNILAHHAVYAEQSMAEVMPVDTFYTGILRFPWDTFRSAFRDYQVAKVLNVPGENPLAEFLQYPTQYERLFNWDPTRDISASLTKNIMSHDFGLKPNTSDPLEIETYIQYIDSKFRLILILEYLEESLILLKRYMCWKLETVLFLRISPTFNTSLPELPTFSASDTDELVNKHKQWSNADYMFYDYFNRTLWDKIKEEGPEFIEEVSHYKSMLSEVAEYCNGTMEFTKYFPRTRWNEDFYFTARSCNLMRMNDLHFTDIFRTIHNKEF